MIKHAFKLMWNRKKRSLLLASEILFSFLVLFVVAGMVITGVINYFQPLGFDYHDVWSLNVNWRAVESDLNHAQMSELFERMGREIKSFPQVRAVSWTMGSIPYGRGSWGSSLYLEGKEMSGRFAFTDDEYAKVMDPELIEGHWYSQEDAVSKRRPIVVDKEYAEQFSPNESPVGKILTGRGDAPKDYIVTGVISAYRFRGEFSKKEATFMRRFSLTDSLDWWPDVALIKVNPGADVQLEQDILKRVEAVSGGMDVKVERMSDLRSAYIKDTLLGTVTLLTVAGFLVFNVALGLFGVLWYSVSRRRAELGLRRAVGAIAWKVSLQIIFEAVALATFAIIVGIILTAQVPILGIDMPTDFAYQDILAMGAAAVMIYLIVLLCAIYPSHLAAKVQPAEALHDE